MNIEDGGGNNCKANLRNGVKKWEAKGAFLKGYGLLKGQESRVKSRESYEWLLVIGYGLLSWREPYLIKS